MKSVERGVRDEVAAMKWRLQPGADDGIVSAALELLRTEKSYISKMRHVDGDFNRRLRAQLMFDESEFPDRAEGHLDSLFSHAVGFVERHESFLAKLKDAAKDAQLLRLMCSSFGEFIESSSQFYIDYALSYADVTYLLRKYQRSHRRFNEFVFVSETCAGESLDSLRMSPVQRIPRYKLMLNELLHAVDDTSDEAISIQAAIDACMLLAMQVDDGINQGEKISQVRVLQDGFFETNVNLMNSERKFIKSGELTKLFNRQSVHVSRGKRQIFFLFSDCLMYSEVDGSHKCKHVLHLSQMRLIELADDDDTNVIRLYSKLKALTLMADNVEDKLVWVEAIRQAIATCSKLTSSAQAFEASIRSGAAPPPKAMTTKNSNDSSSQRRNSLPSFWASSSRLRSLASALAGNSNPRPAPDRIERYRTM